MTDDAASTTRLVSERDQRRLIGTAPAQVTHERAHRVAGRSGDQHPGVYPGEDWVGAG
jgi:hypothetical protein